MKSSQSRATRLVLLLYPLGCDAAVSAYPLEIPFELQESARESLRPARRQDVRERRPTLRAPITSSGAFVHFVLVAVLVLFALAFVSAVIAAALVTRRVVRGLRTGYRSVHTQVSERAAATLTTLQARALPAGPRQEVAELRHHLRRSRDATRRLLAVATGPLGHLPDWGHQLAEATDTLDRELAGLQREPDTARMSAGLTALRPLVREVATAGAELRAAIRQSGSALGTTDWSALSGGIRDEIHAVSAGIAYLHSQTAVPLLPSVSHPPSSFTTGHSRRPGAGSRWRRHRALQD